MPPSDPVIPLESFLTFGDLLKYLRRRARLSQRELCIAVGYSEAQISRLEQNQRTPDLSALTALFIPALYLEDEPFIVTRLMELAAQARGEALPQSGMITFSRSVQRETKESVRTVEEELSNNLPLQLTSFIGREREIAEIKNLFDANQGKARLITLLGSGGSGKTRLALDVAKQLTEAYRDGIWFIELASIFNPALVSQAITSTLGMSESRNDSPINALKKYLQTKHTLLIFDNCEQIVSAVGQLSEEILRICPHVHILATSREVLNVPGEVRFRVPSLTLPQEELLDCGITSQFESVRLFVERAQAVLPDFELNNDNVSFVTQICRRVDGMLLAIELAAARMTTLSVQQIAARLENSFQLLVGGRKSLPRQETLQATIEWSHELLSESERLLFYRLSVFVGGWTLDAAEFVASDPSLIPSENILDLLSKLVNKSLAIVEWQLKSEARYTMLQTIHDFAHEKLRASNEMESMRQHHFDYYHEMGQQGEQKLFAAESSIDWAESEIDNIRAALTWALEKDNDSPLSEERARKGLELMGYIWPLWLSRGYTSEGSEWINQLLATHTIATLARARALLLAGDFARYRGDLTGQAEFFQEALTLARKLRDKKHIAWSLTEIGLLESSRRAYHMAISRLTESLSILRELNETLWVYRTSFLLAEMYIENRNLEAAKSLWEQGLDLCREENDNFHVAWGLEGLGNVERLQEHFEQARQLYAESLNLKVGVMDKTGITYSLEAFAQLAAAQKQFKRASILWGAANHLREIINIYLESTRDDIYTSLIPFTREQIGVEVFDEAWKKGEAMKLDEAIEYALRPPRN